ncbi:MAG: hypothetical protein HYU30_00715 [Chloroflexi bacterium]|nr:hypothetical protein [Chloroflexota bacterium]
MTPAPLRPNDFTMAGFKDIVLAAKASHVIVPFRDVENVTQGKPYLILRHDVDRSAP